MVICTYTEHMGISQKGTKILPIILRKLYTIFEPTFQLTGFILNRSYIRIKEGTHEIDWARNPT